MAIDDVDEPARKSATVVVREMAATPAQASILRDILVDWAQGHGLPPGVG